MPQHRTLALFPQAPDDATTSDTALRPSAPAAARVLMPNRTQVELRVVDLESLVPEGLRARVVWAYVHQALTRMPELERIKAQQGKRYRVRYGL